MFDLADCNPSQRKAVTFGEGPLLLLAGPGSGKTFTITQRILYLLREKNVPPEKILVITFTKEAAVSMQQRFSQTSQFSNTVNFGTFHSVFYHILLKSGQASPGNILNDRQKLNLIFPILKSIKEEEKIPLSDDSEIAVNFLAAISYYKNTGETEEAKEKIPEKWREYFPRVYARYEENRRAASGLDFDDMLKECEALLLQNAAQRHAWQNRFQHILIDEFQDINYRQYSIIRILAKKHKNVFAVGDDDQAIYGFRGAKPDCMKLFEEEFAAQKILLETNYRSRQDIVEASLLVINENRNRFYKELAACEANRKKSGDEVHAVKVKEFKESAEQLQYLTAQLKNKPQGDTCAVLFRTNFAMQSVAAGLLREGIPVAMKEKISDPYTHFIVCDLMAYLRMAQGTAVRADYLRVMNKPFRGISREAFGNEASLEGAEEYYSGRLPGIPEENRRKVYEAVRLLKKQMLFLKNTELKTMISFVRKVCGYERYLQQKARMEKEGESEDWIKVLDWITEDAVHYSTLTQWQEAQRAYGEMLREYNRQKQGQRTDAGEDRGKVRLLTVHASKGLEFDHVWIPDCNEKTFPHGNMPDSTQCEEERRIFYVAMTRAKKNLELLCLTGTRERPRFPSRFLIPLNRYRL